MAKASSRSEGGAGQHFVPSSLLPYGGFGDPDTPAPYWKPAKYLDPHKIALSKAQDRFMRAVRLYLRKANLTEEEFEQQLGYRRYGLVRKLNGQELMTMRDVLKVTEAVPGAIWALVDAKEKTARAEAEALAEAQPEFRRSKTRDQAKSFHQTLQDAIESIEDAAEDLEEYGNSATAALAPTLRSVGAVANEIGRAVASSTPAPRQAKQAKPKKR